MIRTGTKIAVGALAAMLAVAVAAAFAPVSAHAQTDNGIATQPGSGGSNDLQGVTGAISGGVPKARIADPNYDFGTAISGSTVTHVFKIRNAGTGTLIIGGVQTSCGCTAAKPSKPAVAPGEESDIAVSFETRFDKGAASRTITVFTNDPHAQKIEMTLKGVIKVEVDATPSQVAFGEVKRGTEATRQVMINDLSGGKDFRINGATNSSRNIRTAIGSRTDGKPGATLTITLLGTMPVGEFDDDIKVATTLAPIDVSVFGTVTGDLTVKPGQISFGIVPKHQGALRYARLVNASDRAVKVLGVSSTNESVSVAVEPVREGHEYKVTLQLLPNTPEGVLRGALAIRTDDPDQQSVEIPYSAVVGSFKG